MAWPLPPATRRLVGWLFLIAGWMLLLGVALRLYVVYDAYQRLGAAALVSTQLVLYLMMLVAGLLMLRYGWRERRGNDTVD
jgi:multisubunit Na+/H+ antiporter MnhB subunit